MKTLYQVLEPYFEEFNEDAKQTICELIYEALEARLPATKIGWREWNLCRDEVSERHKEFCLGEKKEKGDAPW